MAGIKNLLTKSFLERTISGIVLVIIILAAALLGGPVMYGLTLTLSLVGIFEIYKTVGIEKKSIGVVGYIGCICYYISVYLFEEKYLTLFIIAYLLVLMAAYVFTFPKYTTEQAMLAFFGVIYVAVLMSFMYQLRISDGGQFTFWLIFISSWGCDTCAYLVGVTCGKHKMAPILSPKKSIEGAIGGVIGAALIGAVYGHFVGDYIDIGNAVVGFAIVCGITGLVSMLGDLTASAIKRNYDIKDYGKLIPGHGGVLDRFDSIIFTSPIIYYLVTLVEF